MLLLVDIVLSHDKANVNHQSVVHSSIVNVIFIPLEEVKSIIMIAKLCMQICTQILCLCCQHQICYFVTQALLDTSLFSRHQYGLVLCRPRLIDTPIDTHVYAHTHTSTHTRLHIHTHTYPNIHTHEPAYTHLHTCTYTLLRTHLCICLHLHTHTHTYVCMYTV